MLGTGGHTVPVMYSNSEKWVSNFSYNWGNSVLKQLAQAQTPTWLMVISWVLSSCVMDVIEQGDDGGHRA